MSILQWFALILVIALVAGVYWVVRRQADSDPWRDMEEPDEAEEPPERGEALGGDSYIVGVRTLSRDTPASRKASVQDEATGAVEAGAFDDSVDTQRPDPELPTIEPEPDVPEPQDNAMTDTQARGAGQRLEMRAQRPPEGDQDIFILHMASPDGHFFEGPDIHAALEACDLKFGLNDIYHRVTETHGVAESVFSVANMLKPGTLDPLDQDNLATPGLTLFLVVPGPLDGMRAMRDMMETANALAGQLGGQVLDDKRALLNAQTAQYMLDQIAELDRQSQIARRR